MTTFIIKTLGCKVNQYESDGISNQLVRQGIEPQQGDHGADICIINTCAVTAKAAMQSRQAIRRLIRQNPGAAVWVTGCHAQVNPDQIQAIEGVDVVAGNADKYRIAQDIVSPSPSITPPPEASSPSMLSVCPSNRFELFPPAVLGDMTRAYLKIQDGCNAFCTYCIVPYARGKSRSMAASDVLAHLHALNSQGYREVILTGIHTGLYGQDFEPSMSLAALLNRILDENPVHRIRLSSIEPVEITDELIRLVKNNAMICNHFHIPLQSGDDGILKNMKRPYNTQFFKNSVERIQDQLKNVCIGVDIMVGFPGEDNTAFENTFSLVEQLDISYFHVFPYSARKGTRAYHFKDHVHPETIKSRCARLRELGRLKRRQFIEKNLHQELEGLVQHKKDVKTNCYTAITDNYLSILLDTETLGLEGSVVPVVPESVDDNLKVTGTVIPSSKGDT